MYQTPINDSPRYQRTMPLRVPNLVLEVRVLLIALLLARGSTEGEFGVVLEAGELTEGLVLSLY